MKRLPRKTKGPIRVQSSGRGITDRDSSLLPEVSGAPAPMPQRTGHALSLKLLRFPAVRERTGLSRTTIWRLERHGEFPKHRRISANTVAWVEDEVSSWIQSKIGDVAV
jgi:prophage regulatory protein